MRDFNLSQIRVVRIRFDGIRFVGRCLPATLLVAALCCLSGCRDAEKPALKTEEVQFTKEGVLEILTAESDSVLAVLDIEIADSEYETQTGLMYRKEMKENRGMLFLFDAAEQHAFYMKNTLIPLDIIFIGPDREIATIRRNAQPLDEASIPSGVPVQYVLEVNAGLSDRWGLEPGDRIRWERTD